MIYKGIAKGKTIELEQPLPYEEGRHVTVSVEPAEESTCVGSPALLLRALHQPPHLTSPDVHEMEQVIEAGKLPARQNGEARSFRYR